MRTEPVLAKRFRKRKAEELFLARLNELLANGHDEDLTDLPEVHPTLFVIGPPRSGTTLLTQLICAHLDVGYVNNLIASFWEAPVYGVRLSQKLLGHAPTFSSYQSQFGRTLELSAPHEFGYFWTKHLRYRDMKQRGPEHELTIDWKALRRVIVNMADSFQRPMVFKPFLLIWHLRRMHEVMERSCFVRIQRDPIDNALSIARARQGFLQDDSQWLSLQPSECFEMEQLALSEQVAAQVHYTNREIARQLCRVPKCRWIDVTYRQLCDSPAEVLEAVQDILRSRGCQVRRQSKPLESFPFRTYRDEQTPLAESIRKAYLDLPGVTRLAG